MSLKIHLELKHQNVDALRHVIIDGGFLFLIPTPTIFIMPDLTSTGAICRGTCSLTAPYSYSQRKPSRSVFALL